MFMQKCVFCLRGEHKRDMIEMQHTINISTLFILVEYSVENGMVP